MSTPKCHVLVCVDHFRKPGFFLKYVPITSETNFDFVSNVDAVRQELLKSFNKHTERVCYQGPWLSGGLRHFQKTEIGLEMNLAMEVLQMQIYACTDESRTVNLFNKNEKKCPNSKRWKLQSFRIVFTGFGFSAC